MTAVSAEALVAYARELLIERHVSDLMAMRLIRERYALSVDDAKRAMLAARGIDVDAHFEAIRAALQLLANAGEGSDE